MAHESVEFDNVTSDKGSVVVHPIVLLSVVDHYTRVAKGTNKRVVGALLGEIEAGQVHVTNCFGLPFEEDRSDPAVWFLDHNYHENMFTMFKKVNAKERCVGWYSTGPKIKPADLAIHELFRKYVPNPVFVIVDVQPKELELPVEAYRSVDEATSDKTFRRTFVHIPSTIGAYEAEEVGVEHLLRDIRNASTSTLATSVSDKLTALRTLVGKLGEISSYLEQVIAGKLPPNPQIMYILQDVFNLLPQQDDESIVKAFGTETNDMMLGLYLASVLRSTMTLHELINNKIANKEAQCSKKVETKKDETVAASDKEKERAEAEKDGSKQSKPGS
jgi:26S proteasome regulatory subunit N8